MQRQRALERKRMHSMLLLAYKLTSPPSLSLTTRVKQSHPACLVAQPLATVGPLHKLPLQLQLLELQQRQDLRQHQVQRLLRVRPLAQDQLTMSSLQLVGLTFIIILYQV